MPGGIARASICRCHNLPYKGGYAIMRAGGNTIEFYANDGTLLKTATVGTETGVVA